MCSLFQIIFSEQQLDHPHEEAQWIQAFRLWDMREAVPAQSRLEATSRLAAQLFIEQQQQHRRRVSHVQQSAGGGPTLHQK